MIPGDDFIRVRSNQFNQSFRINTPAAWQNSSGWRKLLSMFSSHSAFQAGQKTMHPGLLAGLNPFHSKLTDTSLISISSSFRNTLSFRPSNSGFVIEYLHQDNRSKNLLMDGFDIRQRRSDALHGRLEASPAIIFSNNLEKGSKSFESEFFPGRNFDIETFSGGISVSFQPGYALQTSLHYNRALQRNIPGGERADQHNSGTEISYTIATKGTLMVRADYFYIDFDAPANTPLAWEMLAGLKPGNNLTMMVQFQQNLSASLQMSLNYNGRTSRGTGLIHTGGMQMRAFF
jgi:hypothetical protein